MGKVYKKYAPATGEFLWDVPMFSRQEVEKEILKAKSAQEQWGDTKLRKRVRILIKFRRNLVRRMDEMIGVIEQETGKTEMDAIVEIFIAANHLNYVAKKGRRYLKGKRRSTGVMKLKKAYVSYLPYGVVGIISPWNYPLILTIVPLAHALIAGNGAVLKPSEHTQRTAELLRGIAVDSGINEDLFRIASGGSKAGDALVESENTDLICFTGSTEVGKKIVKKCADRLKPFILELGGKDPMIVSEDADLERTANGALWGSLHNSGQTCISVERIYVIESIHDKFITLLQEKIKEIQQGKGREVGAMVMPKQIGVIEDHLRDAVKKGAKILHGGKRREGNGQYFEPTIIAGVDHSMKIMREETFGPVISVMKVKDINEALRLANDSGYGLSCSIWSRKKKKAREIAKRIQAGSACINDVNVNYEISSLPYGGFKESGIGKVHGPEGIRAFARQQSIAMDRLGMKRELWWYPYSKRMNNLFKTLIRLLW